MSDTTTKLAEKLTEIKGYSGYTLADMADCSSPNEVGSAGWNFLVSVARDLADAVEYEGENFDPDNFEVHEIADGAPDVYTHTRWQEFVDLGAYLEDPTELGADASDMTQTAGVCLYIIAERLANALLDEIREAMEETDED